MQKPDVQVLSIHDRQGAVLTFDLKDILAVLRPFLNRWTWWVLDLDCTGNKSAAACQAAEAAKGTAVRMSSPQLINLAESISQTIEGKFLAIPSELEVAGIDASEAWWCFQTGLAELAIEAVDSSYFTIYLKDPQIARLLLDHFKDMRSEDPALYFDRP